ncbi:MAG: hypothetical protein R3E31_01795 [Chloroflexota bacterium]
MKGKRVDIFWGLMLVFMGGLFLTRNLGIVPDLSPILWSFLFMAASIGFFASYFIKGKEQWWWLFPALGSASIAVIIWLAEAGIDGAFMGTMVLWSAAIPFFMAYFQDRKTNWWALIQDGNGRYRGIILLENALSDELIGAMIMIGIALLPLCLLKQSQTLVGTHSHLRYGCAGRHHFAQQQRQWRTSWRTIHVCHSPALLRHLFASA